MVTTNQIQEMSIRIQQKFDPDKTILFGSYANGQAREDSDIDLLVVAAMPGNTGQRYSAVRKLLADIPSSFDLVVKTPEEYQEYKVVVNNIVYFAEKYGKVLYERAKPQDG